MNSLFRRGAVVAFFSAVCFSTENLWAQSAVTLQVETSKPGRDVPADFCGLSYETKLALTNKTGKRYFRPDNEALINLFRTLGIKHLRVGGNTAERASVPIPGRADIDSLFAFAKAADIKVIYTVRMESNTTAAAAAIAKYVMDNYRPYVSCLTVGNEPDKTWKYAAYLEEWKKFTRAILAPEYAPEAKFCGPSTTPQGVEWSRSFADDMGGWEHLAYVTQHDYPRKSGELVTNAMLAAEGRAGLLSPDMYQVYQQFHDVFVPAVNAKGIGYRLEEANSYSRGGAVGVSDTFTASLWIVDYLYWWAAHDALGINFHTGEKVMRGLPGSDRPNVYTAFTSTANGLTVLPTGYGMKLFQLGGQGRLVPIRVAANADNVNLVAYGTLAADKTLCITVLNKEFGPTGRAAKLSIHVGMPGAAPEAVFMSAPRGDITAISGITIGGAPIEEDGTWDGKWSRLPAAAKDGSITVTLPAASAAVIRVQGK